MNGQIGFWILSGAFLVALASFLIGCERKAMRRAEADGPPPLPGAGPLGWLRVPANFYRGIDLMLAGLVVLIYVVPVLMVSAGMAREGGTEVDRAVIIGSILSQLFFTGMIFALVVWRRDPVSWLGLRWGQWPLVLLIGPAGVVATWIFAGVLDFTGINEWLLEVTGSERMQEVVSAFTEAEDPWLLVLMVVMAVIVAPITEEVIFRGYLYPVAKRFAGPVPALIFSSLMFALVHGHVVALMPLAFLAVLLVLAYELTGSIWAPIGMHMMFNAATVSMQLAVRFDLVKIPAT